MDLLVLLANNPKFPRVDGGRLRDLVAAALDRNKFYLTYGTRNSDFVIFDVERTEPLTAEEQTAIDAVLAAFVPEVPTVPTRIESATLVPTPGQVLDLGTSSAMWGDVYASSLITLSDERKKDAIEPVSAEFASELVLGLEPVTYRMKDFTVDHYGEQKHRRRHMGFVAQQVAAILGEKASESGFWCCDRDGNQSLRYEQLMSPLVKVVQEQQKRIETLEALVQKLITP